MANFTRKLMPEVPKLVLIGDILSSACSASPIIGTLFCFKAKFGDYFTTEGDLYLMCGVYLHFVYT